ncbi:conjugal transfer protein TraF [Vibrio hepatarius]|uniref:conjugal transfer protein TraF n=1 Tax=Vibrio hepatarius TaxID=171383 RepID=UPI003736D8E4
MKMISYNTGLNLSAGRAIRTLTTNTSSKYVLSLFVSMNCNAFGLTEAQSVGMGGTGVVSGTFVSAPYFNPALSSIYRTTDNAAFLGPTFTTTATSLGNFVSNLSDASNAIENDEDPNDSLIALDGSSLTLNTSIGMAFAVPNSTAGISAYTSIYSIDTIQPEIKYDLFGNPNEDSSLIKTKSVKIKELGLALSRYASIGHQHFTFGVTPKLQTITTYTYQSRVDRFNLDDIKENKNSSFLINFDAGLLWFYGPLRIGVSSKNIRNKQFSTTAVENLWGGHKEQDVYELSRTSTVGLGIVGDTGTFSLDYDLNEREGYLNTNDNTRYLRVGMESQYILRSIRLRFGYYDNLANEEEKASLTTGAALILFNVIQTDVALTYSRKQTAGFSANFTLNF